MISVNKIKGILEIKHSLLIDNKILDSPVLTGYMNSTIEPKK